MYVGIDSMLLKRESVSLVGEKGKTFKALVGVSVTTSDEDEFRARYDTCLQEVFDSMGVLRRKRVYKAAHLLKQAKEKTTDIIARLIDGLEDCIEHLDVYCAYYCQVCDKEEWREVTEDDLVNYKQFENYAVPYQVPNLKLSYTTGKRFMTRRRGETIADLFDRRNLIALSILGHAIQELNFSEDVKDVFKLAFSAILEIVSKLNPFRPPKSTKSGWTVHEYWIPAVHALNNV